MRLGLLCLVAGGCSASGLTLPGDLGAITDLAASADLAAPADLGVVPASPLAPLPPTASLRMYQGGQWAFKTASGTCTGRVVAGMGDNAFCFAAADDSVKCAGTIGGVNYGMTFATVPGQTGARQILISPTFNSAAGNSICILESDHTAACMGYNNNGPFGDGDTAPTTTFVSWGGRSDLVAIGSGTWDQMCALTTSGAIYCAGYMFGATPVAQAGTHTSFWVDTSGALKPDDATVWRPAESRTECQIVATGMVCGPMGQTGSYGPTNGTVVNGASNGPPMPMLTPACWLTADGSVNCTMGPRFAPGKVLHLAMNSYSDSLCAIYVDGSVWCIGSNAQGKLGTGDTITLTVETEVAPPGSALVRCD